MLLCFILLINKKLLTVVFFFISVIFKHYLIKAKIKSNRVTINNLFSFLAFISKNSNK